MSHLSTSLVSVKSKYGVSHNQLSGVDFTTIAMCYLIGCTCKKITSSVHSN